MGRLFSSYGLTTLLEKRRFLKGALTLVRRKAGGFLAL